MLRIEFTGEGVPAGVSGAAVYEFSTSLGIHPARGSKLRVVIEELVSLASSREHGDRPAQIEIRAWTEQGHLNVEVNDQGLPLKSSDSSALHELVRLGFAEFIELQSHGPEGNTARCRLALREQTGRSQLAACEKTLSSDVAKADEFEQLEVRAMRPEESEGLARLVYRCYGYDYPSTDVYYPDRMGALVEAGLMHSAVVINPAGELVGHASLTMATAEARVAEAGKLVVDPRYRSHGLAERMTDLRLEKAEELGLRGLWSECVTNHPYSQRNQLKLGACETGVFLGILPDSVKMVGLESESAERGSLMAMYLPLEHSADYGFHPPACYRETLCDVLSHLELEREQDQDVAPGDAPTRLTLSIDQASSVAVISVVTIGPDFREQLEQRMESLLDMHVAVIYLDLPLGRIRLRPSGRAGGQRGMESIIGALGDGSFARLRFGIGRPPTPQPIRDWVLSPFQPSDQGQVQSTIERAVGAIQDWLKHGIEWAMDRHNRRPTEASGED